MKERRSKYQIACPECGDWFAWFHSCPKKETLKVPIRGMGAESRTIIGWTEEYNNPRKGEAK